MALDLFYFNSTLPTLLQGEKPPFSHKEFLAACEEKLGAESAEKLRKLSLIPGEAPLSSEIGRQWHAAETSLRNLIGQIRLARLPKDGGLFRKRETETDSSQFKKQVEDAMNQSVPSARENALDRIRWHLLEELEASHTFDFAFLEIYALKLQLMEKESSRSRETGEERFSQLLQQAIQEAKQHRISKEM